MANRAQLTSIPNLITYGRIILIPFVVILIVSGDPVARGLALALFIIAAASDWLDGFLARRWNETSPLGQMLDPIADKLLVGALIVVLAWDGSLTAWDLVPAIAILLREIFISGLREFMGSRKITVKVTRLAKWKTTVQLVAFIAVLVQPLDTLFILPADILLWCAAILTVYTGSQYFIGAWPVLSGEVE